MEKRKEKKERHIHSRDMPNFRRNDTDKRKVIKDKKKVLRQGTDMAVRTGVKTTLDQMEGSEEVENALVTAAVVTTPIRKTASKTTKIIREKAKRKRVKEQSEKNVREKQKSENRKIHSQTHKEDSYAKEKQIRKRENSVKKDTTGGNKVKSGKSNSSSDRGSHSASKSRKVAFFVEKLRSTGMTTSLNSENQKSGVSDIMKTVMIKIGAVLLPIVLLLFSIVAIATALVAVVIAVIYNSPFSIFFPPLENGDTVMTVTSQYVAEFNRDINTMVTEHKDCDIGKIVYVDYEGTSSAPSNYYDVMSVYMVKYGVGNTATVMNDTAKANLKTVFDDMCSYTTSTGEEKIKNESGKKEKKKVLYVNVTLKTYHQMETEYGMSDDEISMLNSLMSPENLSSLGITSGSTGTQTGGNKKSLLTQNEINEILNKITDEKAKTSVSFALSKVGYPYSQPLRNSGTHFDCSSLAYYAWNSAGISVMTDGSNTAASEAKWCSDNDCTVKEENLKPGDLIFYSYSNNGRYKNISHVGIYVGDGKMVEAVDEATGVVMQDYHNGGLVMIGRPDKKKKN
ncbi:C40 family peptidase [Eubacterium ventriosum]|uniref:NlpC/P60 family protein n=1 Tax=Eubacterium ventriosum ATCC 27560 TaxID=411463 RepID=A5Z7H1_9FIRM|nr:NlpC/P60 family protein [Eubacterium ventriosum]EDM50878.1 NlpC/P60 family protein [Eubacterium ventriosum ATCC 27560]UWP36294.1 C40 family peptidase [Eubacterium ventriosum]